MRVAAAVVSTFRAISIASEMLSIKLLDKLQGTIPAQGSAASC